LTKALDMLVTVPKPTPAQLQHVVACADAVGKYDQLHRLATKLDLQLPARSSSSSSVKQKGPSTP
jgi:hypothetical protein